MEHSSAFLLLIMSLKKNNSVGFLHTEQIKTNSQRKLRELSNHYVKYLNIRLVYEVKYIHVNPLNAVPYVSVLC